MIINTDRKVELFRALLDLRDLEEYIQKALKSYPQDGKISAIFAHNCISGAIKVLEDTMRIGEYGNL